MCGFCACVTAHAVRSPNERLKGVEVIAIGIGYYRRAVTIVDAEQLGAPCSKLAELFEEERTSQTRVRSRHRRAA